MVALARDLCVVWMCPKLNMHVLRMYVYIDAPIGLGVPYMHVCMHVCTYYVCMYVCTPVGTHTARRSLIGALCYIYVSQVKYARIENVCIYRRADSTRSIIYVCMHACMCVLCMYVCLYSNRQMARRSLIGALTGALTGALCGIESLVKYARIENVCRPIYRRADSTGSAIYVCMHACMYVLYMYVCLYSNRRAIRRADR